MNATANDDLGNLSMARSDAVCAFLSIDERTLRNVLRASEEAGIDVPSVGTGTGRRWFPDRLQWARWYDEVQRWRAANRPKKPPAIATPKALPKAPKKVAGGKAKKKTVQAERQRFASLRSPGVLDVMTAAVQAALRRAERVSSIVDTDQGKRQRAVRIENLRRALAWLESMPHQDAGAEDP